MAIVNREVGAACGSCVFHMPDVQGCFWAVDIDGTFYPVGGVHPPDDMALAHEPDGMCAVERRAVVDGSIRPDGRFLATRFELLPYDGSGRTGMDHPHGDPSSP
ncbi:MAG: DUF6370 family protein [Myxococcota bacterium]